MQRCTHLTEEKLQVLLGTYHLAGDGSVQKMLKLVRSKRGHAGQTRLGGGSVLEEHIYPVAAMVLTRSAREARGRQSFRVIGALGHDLIEDTDVTIEEIRREFGEDVAELIELLTDTGKVTMHYFAAIAARVDAAIIKVCDRWNNTLCASKIENHAEIRRFCDETVAHVIPIADAVYRAAAGDMRIQVVQLRRLIGEIGGDGAYDVAPNGG